MAPAVAPLRAWELESSGWYDLVVYGNVARSRERVTHLATPRHRVWLVHDSDCGVTARTLTWLASHGVSWVRELYEADGRWEGAEPAKYDCRPS
jgi:hypothetical protein